MFGECATNAGLIRNLDFRVCRVDTENMATVKLTAEASEQLAKSPKAMHERITKMLVRPKAWPTVGGVKKLKGNLAGRYRARVGDYRIRFSVAGETLTVDKIGHRKDVYEN